MQRGLVGRNAAPQDSLESPLSETSYSILIADDHSLMREGLKHILHSRPMFKVVGEADNGFEAVSQFHKLKPDLVIMDLGMPKKDGETAIREILSSDPKARILVLTGYDADEYVFSALKAGANGFVLKDCDWNEMVTAICTVLDGKCYLTPRISEKVIKGYLLGKESQRNAQSVGQLSPRELDVLKLIALRFKNKEIGDKLFISVKTVEKHRANLMRKLDLHSATELIAFAEAAGLTQEADT